jgi:hypothetical protein
MSTLKTGNITHPSSTGTAITLDASDNVTINGPTNFNSNALSGIASINGGQIGGNRNLVINGAMQVAQRSTSETISSGTNSYKTVDRYTTYNSGLGTWTQSQDTDAPEGFGFSLKMLCTAADASPAASDRILIQTILEAQNIQSLGFGNTSNTYTVSFYVKSNVTGTYILEQYGGTASATGNNISTAYTIDAADTWERKTITLNVDSGAMTANNTSGLVLTFWLASGSNYTSGTLNTSWSNPANADRAVGQVNLGSATSNYWQITGIQLETGSQATDFQHEDVGTTLQKCQRYYEESDRGGFNFLGVVPLITTNREAPIQFLVRKRATPSITFDISGLSYYNFSANATDTPSSVTANGISVDGFFTIGVTATARTGGDILAVDNMHYKADAEL